MNNDASPAAVPEDARAKRAFLAYMRHELRTPLNAIIGYSEMLIEDVQALHQGDFLADLEKIHASGRRLLSLVNDLLDPAKVEAGLLDQEDFGAKLRVVLRTPVNAVIGDTETLLENVTGLHQDELIPDLENIRMAGGKLLALIDDAVDLARIEAQQMAPGGTSGVSTMTQSMEAAIQPGGDPRAATPLAEGGLVLVVDDNEINRDILSRRLRREGHMVAVACDGAEALAILEDHQFDLVLLDIMMPELNGYQVLERMKANDAWRKIPVIMISALYEMDSLVKCIEMGAEDYLPKPFNAVLLRARVGACLEKKRLRDLESERMIEIERLVHELEVRNKFIRTTFGRYLSDELVGSLLETADGLKFGGELRKVTILMSDLRGFSSLSERLSPAQVVTLLNIYLGAMAEVITDYRGTIDEFIGDAILVIFGAPIQREDDAERAVACAVAMQLAMASVNEQNRLEGLPQLAMGIGINTGEVVAGNIGCLKRTKYGVTGSQVNLTSRIESYTVGGQILISEATLKEVESLLRIDGQMTVEPKGARTPISIHKVGGIGGRHNLFLPGKTMPLATLAHPVHFRYSVLEDKDAGQPWNDGWLVRLATGCAEVRSMHPVTPLSNLRLRLVGRNGEELPGDLYGKAGSEPCGPVADFCVNFTFVPPELADVIEQLLLSADH